MRYLFLDVANVYIDDFGILDKKLIDRIPIKDEKDIQFQINKFLNDYENAQMINENERPNGYQWFYRVKLDNGLNADFGFNLTHAE